MKPRRLLVRIDLNRANFPYADLIGLMLALGFEADRQRGSRQMFHHPVSRCGLNLQNDRGQAKPYQVEQLRKLIEEHRLTLGDDE